MQTRKPIDITHAPMYGPTISNIPQIDEIQLPQSIISVVNNNTVGRGMLFSEDEKDSKDNSYHHTIINFFRILQDHNKSNLL